MKNVNLLMVLLAFLFSACQEQEVLRSESSEKALSAEGPLWMVKTPQGRPDTKAVGVKEKFWKNGDTIRIKFLNGEMALQEKVKEYAACWLEYANIYFEYVAAGDSADVKVSFDLDNKYLSWATIGTDCRLVPQDESSLNFFNLGQETETGKKAEILRGFGHVLGLGYEHQHPDCPMEFADELDIADEYGLTLDEVQELIQQYTSEQIKDTVYDPASIMTIAVPRLLLTRPTRIYATSRNIDLSEMDKAFIARIYPFPEKPVITLVVTNKITLSFSAKEDVKIVWGDGSKDTNFVFVPTEEMSELYVFCEHEYLDTQSSYSIKIYSSNTSIFKLEISDTDLLYLDVSPNINLEEIIMQNANLVSLDISKNLMLTNVVIQKSSLSTLDVSHNVNLRSLLLDSCQLTSLDVSNNLLLERLSCKGNLLEKLNVSDLPQLWYLDCQDNQITQLNLTNATALNSLYCSNNLLSVIDLKTNISLTNLYCDRNKLMQLDVSDATSLSQLWCSYNLLTYLDVNTNFSLMTLICDHNKLHSLGVNNRNSFFYLYCNDNYLTFLDVNATTLDCSNNHLDSLYVKGDYIKCVNNPFVRDEEALFKFVWFLPTTYPGGTVVMDRDVLTKALLQRLKFERPYWKFISPEEENN